MVALTQSPSPFATLLRRSKFATFDPSIAQVFTVYGGDAHRGNWGLKRPLAARRRGTAITVKSVDTGAQQTEWNSAERQAKFMTRYQELNIEPKRGRGSDWYETEFAPGETTHEFKTQRLVRSAMPLKPEQFRTYLEQLRAKRPEFIAYLREKAKTDPRIRNKSMFELAQQPDTDYHAQFLADQTAAAHNTMESRVIDRNVHKNGGLIYSHPSSLQTFLTTKPQPGRVLMNVERRFRSQKDAHVVSFAGFTPIIYTRDVVTDVKAMKWKHSSNRNRGVGHFRLRKPVLRALPVVVGKRQGLKAMKLLTHVQDTVPLDADNKRSNPHMPGSADYVAAPPLSWRKGSSGEQTKLVNFDDPARVKRYARFRSEDDTAQNTIEILKNIIKNSALPQPE